MQRRQNGERLGPAHYGPEPRRIPIEFEFEPLDIGCRAAASEARDAIVADRTYEPGARSGRTTPSSATERHAPAAGATIYENLAFHASLQQELSKSLILSRFFRSTERNFAAYENLCTGCGYGVFEAHGRLCHFCQLVVHGAYERRAAQGEDSANIYENVCDKCAAFYSSDECACCPPPEERPAPQTHPSAPTAAEQAGRATPPDKAKRDKKGLFHGLIGSLRRAKSSATPSRSPRQGKRPEIVHNVEGYESVFRTQDTFDLDRICELKRSQTSRSEQHIYGRLKHPPHSPHGTSASESSSTLPASLSPALSLSLSQSHDHLTLAPSSPVANGRGEQQVSATPTAAASAKVGSKRPRISRPRLLRSLSRSSPGKTAPESAAAPLPAKQSLYLAEHVCQWLTSLRRETHSYWSFGLADDGALCDPKSIPARHTLIGPGPGTGVPTLAPTEGVTNGESNGRGLGDVSGDSLSSGSNDLDLGAVVTLRRPRRVVGEARAKDEVENENEDEARLVRDFKRSLAAKAMNRQRQRQQQRAALEPPATSTAQQRAKRQAIYLKIDESPSDVSSHRRQHISRDSDGDGDGESEGYNNYEQHQHQGRNQNKHQPLDGPASDQVGERGLASHRVALQPITASASKRCAIYELEPEYELVPVPERDRDSEFVNDILSAFESFLRRESTADTVDDADAAPPEVGTTSREPSSAAAPDCSAPATATAIDRETADRVIGLSVRRLAPAIQERPTSLGRSLDVGRLFEDLLLSRGLNRVVVHYDASLSVFLHAVREREPCRRTYWQRPAEHWVRTFHRFVKLCLRTTQPPSDSARGIRGIAEPVGESDQSVLASGVESAVAGTVTDAATTPECETDGKAGDNGRPGNGVPAESPVERDRDSSAETQNPDESAREEAGSSSEAGSEEKPSTSAGDSPRQPKPQVPQRDPRTCISRPSAAETSPPLPARRGSPPAAHATSTASAAMTVPTAIHQGRGSLPNNSQSDHNGTGNSNNNNVEEEEDIYQPIWKFQTVGEVQERYHTDADYYELDDAAAKALRVHDPAAAPTISIATDVEDHGEWETDDEFMFATQLLEGGVDVASTADGDGDGEGRPPEDDGCSLNSSTVRSRSSRSGSSFTGSTVTGYASSTMTMASAASTSLVHPLLRSIGVFYSPTEPKLRAVIYDYDRVQSSTYFAKRPATDSGVGAGVAKVQAGRSPVPPPRTTSAAKTKAASFPGGGGVGESQLQLLPDSVQAWKFLLLDVNYLEDEEDMIVAETEILRAQEPKEDPETRQTQQLNFLQRFKSASIGNLIDIPTEEDKKSIAERMRSKLQRGVLKLNVRSPKSEKKSRGKFRRAEATSLYLEDGMKPKYPIFGAALDQLELNQTTQPNVPRFVVDCVEYIERKECVQQDGLYRASGNKVSIDELKQKLSESYIYDPKLLVTDDIHTLTSLLKQFFRELGAPLIPQETYERLGRNLTEAAAIERLRSAFAEMREPNRSTLKFLIRHLTNVASFSAENRMPASNLAIVWGPCILSANQIEYDIARMNTLAKVLIENYDRIFGDNERLVA